MYFEPNMKTHKEFGYALKKAKNSGVNILALDCEVTKETIVMGDYVDVKLD